MTIWQLLGAIGISFAGCALLLDWDWKRKLFETHQERMARDPKYRDKELRHVRERRAHWYRLKAEEAEREGRK
ncbi:hypothetical protein SAMN03159511_2247 [Pseudomonas sp. NFACC19-2]|nr:hypothetical protein [Pseudomonas sp. NFACC19-2]SFW31845.1 hypothetical protein SAMN03159511_2247 [Pseudomonas sp. NFACC19-2]